MSSSPQKTKGRILVVRGGAIGDFVLTCPVFSALREHFPDTRLEILGYARMAQIAKDAGLVDDFRSIETRAAACFFARNAKLDQDLSAYFAGFSLIFSYLYDPDRFFEINVTKVSKAQFIAAPSKPDEKQSLHAAESFLKALERLAIFDSDPMPELKFARSSDANSWIAVHPAVGNPLRHWPEARWRKLLENILGQSSHKLLLVGGDAERAVIERLANALPSNRIEVLKNAPLSEVAARLASAQAFIGHDSGISDLAAAVGLPCTVLWGAGNQAVWKPLGRKIDLLHRPGGLATLSEEDVLATLPLHRSLAE